MSSLEDMWEWQTGDLRRGGMAALLALGAGGYSGLRPAGVGPLGSLVGKGLFESNENLILSKLENRTPHGTLVETVTSLFRITCG